MPIASRLPTGDRPSRLLDDVVGIYPEGRGRVALPTVAVTSGHGREVRQTAARLRRCRWRPRGGRRAAGMGRREAGNRDRRPHAP